MIWNYYNIIRNLFFLGFVIIFYCIFFITDVNAQSSMTICDSTNKGWRSTNNSTYGENVCTTKCSDLKVNGTGYPRENLSDTDFGHCAGSATSSELTLQGLGANDSGARLIATLRKINVKSKVKNRNRIKELLKLKKETES